MTMLYCENCKAKDNIERKGTIYKSIVRRTMYVVDAMSCILTVRRRRKCLICDYRWATLEINKDKLVEILGRHNENM